MLIRFDKSEGVLKEVGGLFLAVKLHAYYYWVYNTNFFYVNNTIIVIHALPY